MYPEHLKTFDYLGLHQYFLTFCTHDRDRILIKADAVELARTQIVRAAGDQHFSVIAYCFMPDHAHLLIEGLSDDSDCRRFIARAKQYSGFHYQARFGRRVWIRARLRNDEAASN